MAGRTFAAMPNSTSTTSPRLKLVIIHARRRSKLFPCVRDCLGEVLFPGLVATNLREAELDGLAHGVRERKVRVCGRALNLVVEVFRQSNGVGVHAHGKIVHDLMTFA